MDITEKITKRKSVRTYLDKPVSGQDMALIDGIIGSAMNIDAPFGTKLTLKRYVIDKKNADVEMPVPSYGLIKDAHLFIACSCPNTKTALMDYGFIAEKIVLDLTGIGIGTCWVGALFNQKSMQKGMVSEEGHIVPAILVAGYPAQRSTKEKLIRRFSKGDMRLDWEELFFNESFEETLDESAAGIYKQPLEMLRFAPSASNKQPWRTVVAKDDSVCRIYYVKTPGYAGNKMGYEMQRIDIGIALCHFSFSCIEKGIKGGFVSEEQYFGNENGREYIISWKRGVE